MSTYIELFLSEFFTFSSILGSAYDGTIFDYLINALYINSKDKKILDEMIKNPNVADIATLEDYYIFKRTISYSHDIEKLDIYLSDEEYVINLKGKAMLKAESKGLLFEDNTDFQTYTKLLRRSNEGNITALKVLGVMEYLGIIVEKNVEEALNKLDKVAMWGNITGLIEAYYSTDDKEKYCAFVKNLCNNSLYGEIGLKMSKSLKTEAKEADFKVIRLLENAFNLKIVERDTFNEFYADIIFSKIITARDKERLIYSKDASTVNLTHFLPLKMKKKEIITDLTCIKKDDFTKDDFDKIKRSILSSKVYTSASFKPTALCIDSDFELKYYLNMYKSVFAGNNVREIDIESLNEYDFIPTYNNIFIKNCNNDKANVFLLVLKGNTDHECLEKINSFIQFVNRKNFKLEHPEIAIDLSSVFVICVCDNKNARLIKDNVNIVEVEKFGEKQKLGIVDMIINEFESQHKTKKITIDDTTKKTLTELSINSIEEILNNVLIDFCDKKIVNITEENCKVYINEQKQKSNYKHYGFGGNIYEN